VRRARTQLADSKLTRHQPRLGPAIRPAFPGREIHGYRIGQSQYARSIHLASSPHNRAPRGIRAEAITRAGCPDKPTARATFRV
jgi:hypothetical protein